MGLFGGNHNIYKDGGGGGKIKHPAPKSCGACHGTGQRLNGSGRPIGGKCKSCKGQG